jgi:hypothetical protein
MIGMVGGPPLPSSPIETGSKALCHGCGTVVRGLISVVTREALWLAEGRDLSDLYSARPGLAQIAGGRASA